MKENRKTTVWGTDTILFPLSFLALPLSLSFLFPFFFFFLPLKTLQNFQVSPAAASPGLLFPFPPPLGSP